MFKIIRSLSRKQKSNVLLLVDIALIPLALVFTFAAQADPLDPFDALALTLPILPYMIAVGVGLSLAMGISQIQLNAYEGRALGKTALFALYQGIAMGVLVRLFHLDVAIGHSVIFALSF